MKSFARVAAVAAIAVLALSGCLRYNVDMTLSSDNTASGSIVLAVQEGVGEQMGLESDQAALDQLFEGETFGDAYTETDYAADGFVGKEYTFESLPIEELGDFADLFTITREGGDFVVAGTEPPSTEDDASEVPEGAESYLSITFPGEVTSSNGTVEGTTVTWDLFTTYEPLSAVGAASTGGLPFPLWVLIVIIVAAAIVIVGVIVGAVLLSRRGGSPAAAHVPVVGEDQVATFPAEVTPATQSPAPDAVVDGSGDGEADSKA